MTTDIDVRDLAPLIAIDLVPPSVIDLALLLAEIEESQEVQPIEVKSLPSCSLAT